jgi:hypothetical protein
MVKELIHVALEDRTNNFHSKLSKLCICDAIRSTQILGLARFRVKRLPVKAMSIDIILKVARNSWQATWAYASTSPKERNEHKFGMIEWREPRMSTSTPSYMWGLRCAPSVDSWGTASEQKAMEVRLADCANE